VAGHLIGIFGIDVKSIVDSLSPYGEIVLALIIFAETGLLLGFFLPGDSLLFTAGVLAGQGKLDLVLVVSTCFVGAFLGSEVGYVIGEKLGPRLFNKPDSRLFKQEYVERTKEFFDRHGPKTIVLARFVPVVRTFTPVMAGVGRMKRRTYTTYNLIGAVLWAIGVTVLGWALGDAIGENIDTYLLPLVAVVVAISLLPVFLEWRRSQLPMTSAHPVAARTPQGKVGTVRDPVTIAVLSLVTCGIYGIYWYYLSFDDTKEYSGRGIGGGIGLLLALFCGIVAAFMLPAEVGSMYEREGEEQPVSALTAFWLLIPIAGIFIFASKVQGALNSFWLERGATTQPRRGSLDPATAQADVARDVD
jgi:membrane-associated protein